MSENKYRVKNFKDVMSLLSQNPPFVITKLKKNKKFIERWLEQYLDELPIIKTELQYIDETPSLQSLPEWTNEFIALTNKICRECKQYDEVNQTMRKPEKKRKMR